MIGNTENKVRSFFHKSPLQMLCAVLDRLPFKPLEVGIFYTVKITGVFKNLPSQSNVTIREGCETDIESLVGCNDKPERYHDRFRRGDRSLLALDGNNVRGFVWFSDKEAYEEQTGLQLSLPEKSIFIYDLYVDPQQRGKGIPGQIYVLLCKWMAENDKNSIIAVIAYDNDISLRLHHKLGFVPLTKIYYLRFFGLLLQRERAVTTTCWEFS